MLKEPCCVHQHNPAFEAHLYLSRTGLTCQSTFQVVTLDYDPDHSSLGFLLKCRFAFLRKCPQTKHFGITCEHISISICPSAGLLQPRQRTKLIEDDAESWIRSARFACTWTLPGLVFGLGWQRLKHSPFPFHVVPLLRGIMYEARNLIYSCNQGTPECNLSWSAQISSSTSFQNMAISNSGCKGWLQPYPKKHMKKTIGNTARPKQCEGKLALSHNVFVCKLFLSEPLGIEVLGLTLGQQLRTHIVLLLQSR